MLGKLSFLNVTYIILTRRGLKGTGLKLGQPPCSVALFPSDAP